MIELNKHTKILNWILIEVNEFDVRPTRLKSREKYNLKKNINNLLKNFLNSIVFDKEDWSLQRIFHSIFSSSIIILNFSYSVI